MHQNPTAIPRARLKPARWSHQNALNAAKGRRIVLRMHDGAFITGTLVNSDQFTIEVKTPDDCPIFFKSAISSFEIR